MKSWIRRFALLAVMGSIVGGIVMAGCNNTPPDDGTTPPTAPDANAPDATDAPPAPDAAPAPDAEAPAPAPAP